MISTYVDVILEKVLKHLGVELPEYTIEQDPTKEKFCELEWTISADNIKYLEKLYNEKLKSTRKRKLENSAKPVNKENSDDSKERKKVKEEEEEEKVKIETIDDTVVDDTSGR